jgi:hypothetical protein
MLRGECLVQDRGHAPRPEEKARLRTNPIYPFRKTRYTDLCPGGGNKAVDDLIGRAFPQLATILQSGAALLNAGPEQISPFISYERPGAPGYHEAKYAAGLAAQHKVLLSGDTEDVVKEALRESAKQALVDVGKNVAIDIVSQALPVGGAGLVQVGLQILENKDLLKTTEGRQQLAKQAGFTVASMVPVVNIMLGPAMMVMGAIDYVNGKSEMEAEMERSAQLVKMIEDNLDAAVTEARGLSVEMAERGQRMLTEADTAWTGRLRAHYENLVLAAVDDENRRRDLAKAQYVVDRGDDIYLELAMYRTALTQFGHTPRTITRQAKILFLLQFARDLRKIREVLKGQLKPVGAANKTAEQVSAEIQQVAAAMLAKDPLQPIQEVMNLASMTVRGTPAPIQNPAAAAQVATSAAQKVSGRSALLAGGGAVALMAAVKFLPMLLRRKA